jgi:transcriptional regulator with XRE-family HTH domain
MPAKLSAQNLISRFRGAYQRVAKRLGLHPSYVSRVARGQRHSEQVSAALQREIARLLTRRKSPRH